MNERRATFVIPGIWQLMRDLRVEVRSLVAEHGAHVQNGAVVAANELVENAVKYGTATPELADVQLSVEVSSNRLTIRVSNGFEDRESVERLMVRLQELQSGRDPLELFLERLDQVSRDRSETMGLGIYRVAAEGEFHLDAEVSASVVTVIATRSLAEAKEVSCQ